MVAGEHDTELGVVQAQVVVGVTGGVHRDPLAPGELDRLAVDERLRRPWGREERAGRRPAAADPLEEFRDLIHWGARSLDHSHLRIALQHLRAMRGGLDIGGEVSTPVMASHVAPTLPQLALRDIVDFTIVDDVNRPAILPVERCKLLDLEFPHPPSLPRRCHRHPASHLCRPAAPRPFQGDHSRL